MYSDGAKLLKYPITKEQLLKGYIIKAELFHQDKKMKMDIYTDEKVDSISSLIIEKTIDKEMYDDYICEYRYVYSEGEEDEDGNWTPGKKRLVYKSEQLKEVIKEEILKKQQLTYHFDKMFSFNYMVDDEVKNIILQKLKEKFPDTRIEMGPLKNYLFIDWN